MAMTTGERVTQSLVHEPNRMEIARETLAQKVGEFLPRR
jgi:hypothetical protein